MTDPVIGKISEEDYQKFVKLLKEDKQKRQELENTILNNPISCVISTRTVWNKQLNASVTECLVSFDGEEPAWIPLRTIQGIYAYLSKNFNSVQI